MSDANVARTIFNQLGGNRFAYLTSSKNFVLGPNSLKFQLARNKLNATHLQIKYHEGADLYEMVFSRFNNRALAITVLKVVDDVYCDMLLDIFEENTGLFATLNRRG